MKLHLYLCSGACQECLSEGAGLWTPVWWDSERGGMSALSTQLSPLPRQTQTGC